MNKIILTAIITWLVYGCGFWLIIKNTSPWVGLGIFLVIFANNLERRNRENLGI